MRKEKGSESDQFRRPDLFSKVKENMEWYLTRLFQLFGLDRRLNLSTSVALWTPTKPVRVGGPLGSSQIVSPIWVPAKISTTFRVVLVSCYLATNLDEEKKQDRTYSQLHRARRSGTSPTSRAPRRVFRAGTSATHRTSAPNST